MGNGGDGRELRPQHTQAAGVTRGTEKPSDAVMTTSGVCVRTCAHTYRYMCQTTLSTLKVT